MISLVNGEPPGVNGLNIIALSYFVWYMLNNSHLQDSSICNNLQ